jgi:hypothetical protein
MQRGRIVAGGCCKQACKRLQMPMQTSCFMTSSTECTVSGLVTYTAGVWVLSYDSCEPSTPEAAGGSVHLNDIHPSLYCFLSDICGVSEEPYKQSCVLAILVIEILILEWCGYHGAQSAMMLRCLKVCAVNCSFTIDCTLLMRVRATRKMGLQNHSRLYGGEYIRDSMN